MGKRQPETPGTRVRAAIYVRISEDREGLEKGVDRQREDCLALADRLGFEVVGIYPDDDISASTKSTRPRPQYDAMLRQARAGAFSAILAYSNSRLTRRPREVEDLIELHDQCGVRLHTVVSGDDDLSTADGRMIARIKGNVDAAEAERIGERVKRAKAQAVAEGRFRGGRRPFGYEEGGMVLRESEAQMIRDATAAILAGRGLGALATELRERGVMSTAGKPIQRETLRALLMRPRNAGLVSKGRSDRDSMQVVGPAAWPAIVDEDTWRAAWNLLADPSRKTNGGVNEARWLGSFIYRCGYPGCGAPMRVSGIGQTPSRVTQERRYVYRCHAASHLMINQRQTDAYIRNVVAERVRDPRVLAALTPDAPDLSADRERRMVLAARLAQTEADYDNDLIDARRYRTKADKIAADLAEVDARLALGVQRSVSSPILAAPDPGKAFLDAPIDVQRAVLAAVLSVEVKRAAYQGAAWTSERLVLSPVVPT
jgi:DNA invertase Pin-like site-specific DNA recombinase